MTSQKSCLNESHESSTSAKEFINDHGTLFKSLMKLSITIEMLEIPGINYSQGKAVSNNVVYGQQILQSDH